MPVHRIVTTEPRQEPQDDGSVATLPVGTVLQRIIWDGEAPYDPGAGVILEPED